MRIMKTLLILIISLFLSEALSGQALHKGTVIECNEIAVVLHPGRTIEEYLDIMINQFAPEIERLYPDTEVYIVKGNRGNAESKVGAIWTFASTEVRDRYFDEHGNPTLAEQEARAQLAPVVTQMEKIGKGTRYSMVWEVVNEPRSGALDDYYDYLIEYSSRENFMEMPISPATMGVSDPLVEKLVREISETTGALIESGDGEGDPLYNSYASRIESSKKSLLEVATKLEAQEERAFQKGGSFGYHKLTVDLAQDSTMQQYVDFYIDKYTPTLVELLKGIEVLIMVPYNEPLVNQFTYVYYFRSEQSRDQYWPEPDSPSTRHDQAMEQMKNLEFDKLMLGTEEDDYGVWIIQ